MILMVHDCVVSSDQWLSFFPDSSGHLELFYFSFPHSVSPSSNCSIIFPSLSSMFSSCKFIFGEMFLLFTLWFLESYLLENALALIFEETCWKHVSLTEIWTNRILFHFLILKRLTSSHCVIFMYSAITGILYVGVCLSCFSSFQ